MSKNRLDCRCFATSAVKTFLALVVAGALSCQSTDRHPGHAQVDVKNPPRITAKTSTNDAIQTGIDYGGDTLHDVKLLIGRRGDWAKAEALLDRAISDGIVSWDDTRLVNAVHLYQSGIFPANPELFERMVSSGRPLAKQLGWQIATTMPSKGIAKSIDAELTRALREDDEQSLFVPQMASAVAANRLKDSYSVLVQGLYKTGHEGFAKAMATLNTEKASEDFLNYLSKASVDELRQISVSSINVYAAVVMFKHMTKFAPAVDHPHFDHLFLYTISRNIGLADAAANVIQSYLPQSQDRLAIQLARQPAWVQIAYIESVRRKMTPVMGLFLAELKRATAQQDVVEEIAELRL